MSPCFYCFMPRNTTFESNKSSIKWTEKIRLCSNVQCTCSHCTDLPISHNLHDNDCLPIHFNVCWLNETFSQPKIKTDNNNRSNVKTTAMYLTIEGICINQIDFYMTVTKINESINSISIKFLNLFHWKEPTTISSECLK